MEDAVKAHCDPVGQQYIDQSEQLRMPGFVVKQVGLKLKARV